MNDRFIEEVEQKVCAPIEAERLRFRSSEKLLRRFRNTAERLLTRGLDSLNQFNEHYNELLVAYRILFADDACASLEYEPPLPGSNQRMDFGSLVFSGKHHNI